MIVIFLVMLLLVLTFPEPTLSASSSAPKNRSAKTFFHLYSPIGKSSKGTPFATISPTGLTPNQIRSAYNLPSTGGNGTIAIVDAYDCPTVQNDFTTFSQQFELPTVNFEVHKMARSISVNANWSLEISLDVQWAHAIAPNAKILLVEARSSSIIDLLSAVKYAAGRPDVVAVSMSWGTPEFLGQTVYDSYFTSNHGVVFFAAAGDNGAGVIWPSTSSNVIAVGGTTLAFSNDGKLASETAWSGSGGGVSAYETEPQYQITYNVTQANGNRAVPDVSYDANPTSGFPVYDTTAYNGQTGWFQVGGTSAGAPQWAAMHSLGLSVSNNNLYQDAKWSGSTYFRDITSGSNGAYSASSGYDLVTGLGSPLNWNFTVGIGSDFSISLNPPSLTMPSGTLTNSNITITSLNGFAGEVSFAAPADWNASFNPSSLVIAQGGSNQSLLSLTTSSNTQAGTYNVSISGSSGAVNRTASLFVTISTQHIIGFNLQSGGSDYTTPTVILSGGGGTGATATARVSNGVILDLVLTNSGTGYTSTPTVIIRDPSPKAQGAAATAVMTN